MSSGYGVRGSHVVSSGYGVRGSHVVSSGYGVRSMQSRCVQWVWSEGRSPRLVLLISGCGLRSSPVNHGSHSIVS